METLHAILDLARWAPSGDNTQPWRFEIDQENHLVVHGFDTRAHCVYDLHGRASQLSLGAFLQTFTIAASKFGLSVDIRRRTDAPPTTPKFDVYLSDDERVAIDPLCEFITRRATQRLPMKTNPLTDDEKAKLENAAGPEFTLKWWTSARDRLSIARLLLKNARLRLITPEAFEVHRSVIEWDAQFSETSIPDRALGLDPIGRRLTRWVLGNERRMKFVNSIPGGTLLSRFQLDFVPALLCAGHFALLGPRKPRSIDDFVAAGMAVQRVWLTLTSMNRWQQPEMTPLIFSDYIRDGVDFTRDGRAVSLARIVSQDVASLIGRPDAERAVWMGRTGAGIGPSARSVRKAITDLLVER